MRAVVVGDSPLSIEVASALHRSHHDVALVQPEVEKAEPLLSIPGVSVTKGDPLLVLEAAGALKADVLFCCTRSDADNLLVSYLAKKRFGVARVVALANLVEDKWLFTEAWGVDRAVSAVDLLVDTIVGAGSGDVDAPPPGATT